MCGIAGFLSQAPLRPAEDEALARAMGTALTHRGPDSAGEWLDETAGIALAHRRLSILDLSAAGHQPMHSPSGRYVIVFNGEIYNHLVLRSRLGPGSWRGHSDTETLLAAIERWGLEATLRQCVGMFALALWDRRERVLHLARDRLGEKPLYYGLQGGTLLFASELKALRPHPAFPREINRAALTLYMRYGYVPAPWSIHTGIAKLPAGTCLRVPHGNPGAPLPPPVAYWTLDEARAQGQADPFTGSDEDAIAGLESRIAEAVGLQMIADVPLGAFLSGGVDSSVVVALMQAQSSRKIRTFTIGFTEKEYDEAPHARSVARHLGTEHTEHYATAADALAIIPQLASIYDEPFADASAIPTILVSRIARAQVTVSLSGDGGDELFGGYDRYRSTLRHWEKLSSAPLGVRSALARAVATVTGTSGRRPALADALASPTDLALYRTLMSQWPQPERLVVGGQEAPTAWDQETATGSVLERMMYTDAATYLPDDILCKVDRAAMSVSLETRVPLLDHRVVEFAWRLPASLKLRQDRGKWILRQVLERHLPRNLIDRPKKGFAVPVDHWLRGPLRPWAEDLLAESRLRQQGYLRPELIRRRWEQHLSGRCNWRDPLWVVLMFQAWLANESNPP